MYRMGDADSVRLAEANQVTGGLILKILEDESEDGAAPRAKPVGSPGQARQRKAGPPRTRSRRRR
jgi:hypothetical protein